MADVVGTATTLNDTRTATTCAAAAAWSTAAAASPPTLTPRRPHGLLARPLILTSTKSNIRDRITMKYRLFFVEIDTFIFLMKPKSDD